MFGFEGLLWLVAIGVVIGVVIGGKASKKNSQDYAKGYWDGYRTREQEVKQNIPLKDEAVFLDEPAVQESTAQLSQPAQTADPKAKEKRDIAGVNTTLYVASFLLVAAAALFIGTSLPEMVKFLGTWAVTVAFYVVGLALHARSVKLRPAAVAFAGTGLALLPFTGVAMYSFVLPDAAMCWFVTSLIGVAAFVLATVRLQSQVVAYFALAFMVSLTTSAPAVLQLGLMWYFVFLLGFGSVVTVAAALLPNYLPEYFRRPVALGGQWIVPLTLVASLLSARQLTLGDYEIIAGLTTVYYLAVALSNRGEARALSLLFARILATVTILIISYDYSASWTIFSGTLTVVAVLQAMLSVILLPKHKMGDVNNEVWLWLGMALQVLAPVFAVGSAAAGDLLGAQLFALLATSLCAAFVLRRAALLGFAIYSLALLPMVYGFMVLQPSLEASLVAGAYIGMALVAIGLTVRRAGVLVPHPSLKFPLVIAYMLFTFEALALSAIVDLPWRIFLWLVASAILYGAAYIEKVPLLMVLPNILFLVVVGWITEQMGVASQWQVLATAWMAAGAFYGAYWLAKQYATRTLYSQVMLWSVIVVAGFAGLIMAFVGDVDVVVAAGLTNLVAMGLLAREGWVKGRLLYVDVAAVFATMVLQRMTAVALPGLDWIVYTQWWAALFALLAYLYYVQGARVSAKVRLIIGLVFLTLPTGVAALGAGDSDIPYRLIFLLEHAGLVAVGLFESKKLVSIWGAVGVVLAVLWLLSGYTYLLLAATALGLIGFAVYRLTRKSDVG